MIDYEDSASALSRANVHHAVVKSGGLIVSYLSFKVNFGAPFFPVVEVDKVYFPDIAGAVKKEEGKDLSTGRRDQVRIHKAKDRLSPYLVKDKYFQTVKVLTFGGVRHYDTLHCFHVNIIDVVTFEHTWRKGVIQEIITLRFLEGYVNYVS